MPALRRARNPFYAYFSAGGVPPFICSLGLYVCADTLGGSRYPVLPFDPISLVLAQRNGVEPPKKSAFLPWRLHHPRERFCLGGRGSSSPDLGQGLVRIWTACLRRGRTGLVMAALRGRSSSRASLSLSGSALLQKRVSLGLHPVSLRKSKEMGWNGQQGGETTSQRNGAHVQGENKKFSPRFLCL